MIFMELRPRTSIARGRVMKKVAVLCVLSFSSCFSVLLPSNDPDSGVNCAVSVNPTGRGTNQGAHAFSVGSVYQRSAQTIPPDAGITGATLDVSILRDMVSCAGRRDAGTSEGLFATVSVSGADRVTAGTYQDSAHADGGSSFFGFAVLDGGAYIVSEGTLTLTTVATCSATGSFEVKFQTGDGGVSIRSRAPSTPITARVESSARKRL